MNPKRRFGASALVNGVLALSMFLATTGCKKKEAEDAAPAEHVHVTTVEIKEQPMPRSILLTGSLRGQRQTDLAADASGRVLETHVERGTSVAKGDVIAKLDVRQAAASAAEARANVELARAQETSAQRDCERYKDLLARHAITQAEFDRTADQCKTAPLSLRAAEARAGAVALNITDGTVRAPFAGLVSERLVEVGQYVHPDTKVATIVDVDPLRLELTVPEVELAAVKPGVAVNFTVAAYPDRTFSGTVKFVSAAVREATRDVVAEAEVPNPDHLLLPGMFAAVELETGERPAPVLPKTTLLKKEDHEIVYAVVDGHLEERVVQLGVTRGDVIACLRGVKAGDVIVDKPTADLLNGAAVE